MPSTKTKKQVVKKESPGKSTGDLKFISWNVNGIRSVLTKGFLDFVKKQDPDFLCLQETKATPSQVTMDLSAYHPHWCYPDKRAGYSGTAIFSKVKPIKESYGIGALEHDSEGRVITLEFKEFYLVDVYTPNSKRDLSRLPYRSQEWDVVFLSYLKKLEKKKPVIFCGDLNVAHTEIDLTYPKANRKNHGFTDEERAGFENIIKAGFLDTFREFTKEGGHYSWWSRFSNCRERNIGWRIDYFCVSGSLKTKLKNAYILPQVQGSDHAPVVLITKDLQA